MLWFSLVALSLGVGVAVLAARRRTGPKDEQAAVLAELSQMPVVALKGAGICDLDIDNEAECQEALVRLCGNEFGTLHDVAATAGLIPRANASVRVEIDRLLVGRLDRDTAAEYGRQMSALSLAGQPASCGAVIAFSDAHECYQVRLDLLWPLALDTPHHPADGSPGPPRPRAGPD